jgi:hypothetical protein
VISVRRALPRFAAGWLICQVATLTLAPMLAGAPSARVILLECTCSHGDHATCPMHHKPAAGTNRCAMRSTGDGGSGVLGSLLGPMGLITVRAATITPPPILKLRLDRSTATTLRPTPPDPPPPRA